MAQRLPHYPGRAPIDAYGDGGFRFAGMSHQGSILCLPSGIYSWRPAALEDVKAQDLFLIGAEAEPLSFILFGTGPRIEHLSPQLVATLVEAGVAAEPMDTGAACRTYNVLLAEQRPVGAALLKVA